MVITFVEHQEYMDSAIKGHDQRVKEQYFAKTRN
jgi:hypothetical protein